MILIENDIIFLSVPKNASTSVHFALEDSEFEIEPTFEHDKYVDYIRETNPILFKDRGHKIKVHPHIATVDVYSYLGKKLPTIFIERDFSERFVSACNFIFNARITLAYPELIDTLEYIDNDWIYKNINDEVVLNIIQYEPNLNNPSNEKSLRLKNNASIENVDKHIINILKNISKNKVILNKNLEDNQPPKNVLINFKMLDSQEIYKSGYTPKYIFNIHELDKLENFLYDRYGKKIKIQKVNAAEKSEIKTNIINDTKLRNWVWNKFEKHHFIKKIF